MDRPKNGKPPRRERKNGVSAAAGIFLLLLIVLPAVATWRLTQIIDSRWIAGYLGVLFVVTYLLYRHDKQWAEMDGWRTPESTLHLAELLGGWPAAYFAQRKLRHKISKIRYQIVFWLIVAVHEFVSFDFVQGWTHSRKLFALIAQ
jgi:uncharacterized membrane protein YsdA (DUF1294 family)